MACFLATPEALLLGFSPMAVAVLVITAIPPFIAGVKFAGDAFQLARRRQLQGNPRTEGVPINGDIIYCFFFGPLIGIYRDIIWIMIGMYCLLICCIAMEECCL
jgi:hypothetical protein